MSAPAEVTNFGDRKPQTQTPDNLMRLVSDAARKEIGEARRILREEFDGGVSRLTSQYEDIDSRLQSIEGTIEEYSGKAAKAMGAFIEACQSATLETKELMPLAEKQAEEQRREPPKFLSRPHVR